MKLIINSPIHKTRFLNVFTDYIIQNTNSYKIICFTDTFSFFLQFVFRFFLRPSAEKRQFLSHQNDLKASSSISLSG